MAAKGTIAEIRRKKKEFSDMLSTTRKAWMSPYDEIKGEADEITKMFDDPIKLIDSQIKECEAREKEEKREKCEKVFSEILDGSVASEYLSFEKDMKPQWLNVSTTMASVKRDITAMKEKVEGELQLLTIDAGEYLDKAIEVYKETGNSYVSARMRIRELREFAEYVKKQEELLRQREKELEEEKNSGSENPITDGSEEITENPFGNLENPFGNLENPFGNSENPFLGSEEDNNSAPEDNNPISEDDDSVLTDGEFVSILVKKSDLGRIKELLEATGFAYKF